MEIKITILDADKNTVAEAFKQASSGYPTDSSDEQIVTDGLVQYMRSVIATHQEAVLQAQATQDAINIANQIVLE